MIELDARSCTDRELRRDTNCQSASHAIYVSQVHPIETNLFKKISTANDFLTLKKHFTDIFRVAWNGPWVTFLAHITLKIEFCILDFFGKWYYLVYFHENCFILQPNWVRSTTKPQNMLQDGKTLCVSVIHTKENQSVFRSRILVRVPFMNIKGNLQLQIWIWKDLTGGSFQKSGVHPNFWCSKRIQTPFVLEKSHKKVHPSLTY